MELSHVKKNKVTLSDYDYEKDIKNRILMSEFSNSDLTILEEILYSPLTFSVERLVSNLKFTKEELIPVLNKLSQTGLFTYENDLLTVDKEMRKYFEFQVLKFEENFIPDLEFLHGMLKKVPIHVLPIWYAIPRTSDNIFESLIEKYFQTPQTFQRYLLEINLGDPLLSQIVQDVFQSPNLKIPSKELIQKYNLKQEKFEEFLLVLEFNFLCCLAYDRSEDHWYEVVTPFREWREYLLFIQDTAPKPLKGSKLYRKRPSDFSFVIDMSGILSAAQKSPLPLNDRSALIQLCDGLDVDDPNSHAYVEQILTKLKLIKLADRANERLYPLEDAQNFLDMRIENRAVYLYRHPLNRIASSKVPDELCTEKNIREAEKTIQRILDSGWVYFDEFMKGVLIPLTEETKVTLKRQGCCWKYSLPNYSEEEKNLIWAVIFEWLFEAGIVAVGTQDDRDCFCVTPFGQNLFAK